jgi:hypothetical protein
VELVIKHLRGYALLWGIPPALLTRLDGAGRGSPVLADMGEQSMNRFFRSRLVLGFTAALGLAVLAEDGKAATMACDGTEDCAVTQNFDPAAELKVAVRYRNMGNMTGSGIREIRIGTSSGGGVISAGEGDVPWALSHGVTYTYVPTTTLRTTTNPASSPSPVSKTLTNSPGDLNTLEITIEKNSLSTTLNLNNVSLVVGSNTYQLGNFVGSGNPTRWRVTEVDLTNGFTLSGTLVRSGSFSGVDGSYVQIDAGYVTPPLPPPPSDTVGPVTKDMVITPAPVILNGEATVKATVDDSGDAGDSNIKSAEYSLNGEPWLPMIAQDDAFDAISEAVEATFTATNIGLNEVCVRGTDAHDNTGDTMCQTFLVTYKFTGFFSPIDNDLLNVAKAGQAIPAKWRLTDANDVPINNLGSFKGLFSSVLLCTGGQPTDAVEQYAAGSSNLQYNGDGYWQFNWKTPKDYADTCQGMYVEFDSGASSPVVKFQFKR